MDPLNSFLKCEMQAILFVVLMVSILSLKLKPIPSDYVIVLF